MKMLTVLRVWLGAHTPSLRNRHYQQHHRSPIYPLLSQCLSPKVTILFFLKLPYIHLPALSFFNCGQIHDIYAILTILFVYSSVMLSILNCCTTNFQNSSSCNSDPTILIEQLCIPSSPQALAANIIPSVSINVTNLDTS